RCSTCSARCSGDRLSVSSDVEDRVKDFSRRSSRWQRVTLELASQILFGKLADAGLRDLVDEHDIVRQPPLGHLVAEERVDLFLRELFALLHDDARQRALGPLGVRY